MIEKKIQKKYLWKNISPFIIMRFIDSYWTAALGPLTLTFTTDYFGTDY